MCGADVYVAQFDEGIQVQPVQPAARQRMIDGCADTLGKQQHYCVWQLLDYALKQHCGKGVDELSFAVDGNGKWSCNGGVNFSLSHSGRVVAVALSSSPVGVDVEAVDGMRFNARLARRILTDGERTLYDNAPQQQQVRLLAEFWTKKESIFKRDGGKAFAPVATDTTGQNVACKLLEFGKKEMVLAVANILQ